MIGWIDVTWDHGGANSYRMGAEGRYDLQLADNESVVQEQESSIEAAQNEQQEVSWWVLW